MPRSLLHRPLYREILREALSLAWKEKRFWPLALLTVFLQTGGIYDVFFFSLQAATRSPLVRDSSWHEYLLRAGQLDLVGKFALTQSILLSLAVIGVILFLSVFAQGVLVACVDRGQTTTGRGFRQIVQTVARRIVPLVVLNLLVIGLSSLGSLGLKTVVGTVAGSAMGTAVFVVAALVYLVLLFVLTSLHLFTLNGMMADGMTLHEALSHAWELLRKAWLTIAETALCMMLIGATVFGLSALLSIFGGLPMIAFMIAALYLGLPKVFVVAAVAISLAVFLAAVIGGLFAVNFQFATWNRLYRRAVEGTAHSKLVRVMHALTSRRARSTSAR